MAFLLRKNFARGILAANINSTVTQLTVNSGHTLPTAIGDFVLVIWDIDTYPDPANDPNLEIVLASYSGTPNLYNITRAQEGTSGVAHSADDRVALHYTAGMSADDLSNVLIDDDIGVSVQAHGAVLDDLNDLGVSTADNQFLVSTGAGVLAWESGATVRTSIGLGLNDSPTLANLYLNHATGDTLLQFRVGGIPRAGIQWVESAEELRIVGAIENSVIVFRTMGANERARIAANGYFGIGALVPDARVEIETLAAEGKQALTIDQNDQDKAFIDFQGSLADDFTKNISTCKGTGCLIGPKSPSGGSGAKGWEFACDGKMLLMEVCGASFWIPAYKTKILP